MQDNAHKSELLYKVFFHPLPDNNHVDPNFEYPPPVCEFKLITDPQIHRAIKKLSPFKALGLNSICNIVLMCCTDQLVPFMGSIFRVTFTLEVYLNKWKRSSTIVLRKSCRPDYSVPKAYHPIMLLDTMAKILLSCVVDELTYISEQHNLLPTMHFSGCPGCSTTDSLHLLTKFITDSWASQNNHVLLLFLDIKAAFLSIVVNKLKHNFRKMEIPQEYVNWYGRHLENQSTYLFFDNYQSNLFNVVDSIYQGCPLSPLLWCTGLIAKGRGRKGGGRGARGFMSQMARVQRIATLLVTEGLRSTATDMLDIHTNILPF